MLLSEADPKGLIRESYRIEGITAEQCRSVFVDWALSLPVGLSLPQAINALMAEYDAAEPGHPMGVVMREGLQMPETPRRRGGRAGRLNES